MQSLRYILFEKGVLAFLLCISILPGRGFSQATQKKQIVPSEYRFLDLKGNGYQRGLTHGKTLKKEIAVIVASWKESVQERYQMSADSFIMSMVAHTKYLTDIKKWSPDLLDEIRGIAEGSGQPFNNIYMLQLMDEVWVTGKEAGMHHCTSIGAVINSEETITAQTMDIPSFYHVYPTVLKIRDEKGQTETYMFTFPGSLGLTGMNRYGVSVNCNTLEQLDHSTTGLPVSFIIRGALKKRTYNEARDFLKQVKHASGQNYIIGAPGEVASFECSLNEVTVFYPFKTNELTYHTNYPLVNKNLNKEYLLALKENHRTIQQGVNNCGRFISLQKRFPSTSQKITIDDIKNALSSKDDPEDPIQNRSTYGSVIYMLNKKKPVCYISPGRSGETGYLEFLFDR
jgi:hypothetical protein